MREQDRDEDLEIIRQMLDDFESQFGLRVTNVQEEFGFREPGWWTILGKIENFIPNEYGVPIHGSLSMHFDSEGEYGMVYINIIVDYFDTHEESGGLMRSVQATYDYGGTDRWTEIVWQRW